jgi:hypothetical protein
MSFYTSKMKIGAEATNFASLIVDEIQLPWGNRIFSRLKLYLPFLCFIDKVQ